jgi:excisionase family DNA binding protein
VEAWTHSSARGRRLAYSVGEAARLTRLARDLLYDGMRPGNLACRKVGRRRLITRQYLEQFLGIAPARRLSGRTRQELTLSVTGTSTIIGLEACTRDRHRFDGKCGEVSRLPRANSASGAPPLVR